MVVVTRSAMLQMRVTPGVKHASEEILRRIGLTMTDAMELFLRRMIVDQRIPFDVVALDNATFSRLASDLGKELTDTKGRVRQAPKSSSIKSRSKRE